MEAQASGRAAGEAQRLPKGADRGRTAGPVCLSWQFMHAVSHSTSDLCCCQRTRSDCKTSQVIADSNLSELESSSLKSGLLLCSPALKPCACGPSGMHCLILMVLCVDHSVLLSCGRTARESLRRSPACESLSAPRFAEFLPYIKHSSNLSVRLLLSRSTACISCDTEFCKGRS